MAQIKFYDGSQWVKPKAIKIWDGTQWVKKIGKIWDGSNWIPIISYLNYIITVSWGLYEQDTVIRKVNLDNGTVEKEVILPSGSSSPDLRSYDVNVDPVNERIAVGLQSQVNVYDFDLNLQFTLTADNGYIAGLNRNGEIYMGDSSFYVYDINGNQKLSIGTWGFVISERGIASYSNGSYFGTKNGYINRYVSSSNTVDLHVEVGLLASGYLSPIETLPNDYAIVASYDAGYKYIYILDTNFNIACTGQYYSGGLPVELKCNQYNEIFIVTSSANLVKLTISQDYSSISGETAVYTGLGNPTGYSGLKYALTISKDGYIYVSDRVFASGGTIKKYDRNLNLIETLTNQPTNVMSVLNGEYGHFSDFWN